MNLVNSYSSNLACKIPSQFILIIGKFGDSFFFIEIIYNIVIHIFCVHIIYLNMGIFKKAGKMFHKASGAGQKLFQKGEVGGTKLFGKGSEGSKILGQTSKGLNQASGVARQVGVEVGKFADNPAVQAALMSAGPYGEAALGAAKGVSVGLGGASKAMSAGSALTKQKNYSGSAGEVAGNIVERAKSTHDAGSNISFV